MMSTLRLLLAGALVSTSVMFLPASAMAGIPTPKLTIVGATGVPGGTVGVVIQLSDDVEETGATADLDIRFPVDVVEFHPPVIDNCRIAERLAETHEVAGSVPEPGLLRLAVIPHALMVFPMRDGELATCDFHILPSPAASSAPLTIEFIGLFNNRAHDVPVEGVDGTIDIVDATPVPTPAQCGGDCNGDGRVRVDELVRGTRIALNALPLTDCPSLDQNGNGAVSVAELVAAVNNSLNACSAAR